MPGPVNGVSAPTLQTFDPELSFVAAQAAIELDNLLLRSSDKQLPAVEKLASYLRDSTAASVGTAERRNLMDPQTIDVVSRAIDAVGDQTVKTIDDLTSEAWRIANELGAAGGGSGKEIIARLRAFCVALSHVAASQRQAVIDMQPRHPFRS